MNFNLIKTRFSDQNENLFLEDPKMLSSIGLSYDVCSDCIIEEYIANEVYKTIYALLGVDIGNEKESCNIVLNNTGNGQFILSRPTNSILHIFNSDMYAHNIALVQSAVAKNNTHNDFFKVDISAIFGGIVKGNTNADVVICQGFCKHLIYQDVDSEMFYRRLDCHEYFTLRAINLVQDNGVVVSVIPNGKEDSLVRLCSSRNAEKVASIAYGDVKILFFQKNNVA